MIASFTEFTGEIPANIYVSRSYYFQPNKTIELIAAISRKAILDANQPCTTKPIEDKTHGQNVWPDSGLKYLENNTIGKLIVRSAFIDTSSVFNKRCSDLSLISAVQLLLALKAYTNEEGELPKTLELLVPEYIAQIPEDPFAGRPLSYSAEKKIIYSIGVNRIDDGGVVQKYEETWNSMKDQVIKIPF